MANFSAAHRDPSIERFEYQLHQAIPAHIGQVINGKPVVWQEIVSDHMHLDVYCWAPNEQYNRWTLVTVGMSAHTMNVPSGNEYYQRAELLLTLPGDWPPMHQIQAMPRSEAMTYFWPIDAMKTTARIPYLTDSWLATGHTTQAGPEIHHRYHSSKFSGLLAAPVQSLPKTIETLEVAGSVVHIYGLYPLYADELLFALNQPFGRGTEQLYHRFLEANLYEGVFPERSMLL